MGLRVVQLHVKTARGRVSIFRHTVKYCHHPSRCVSVGKITPVTFALETKAVQLCASNFQLQRMLKTLGTLSNVAQQLIQIVKSEHSTHIFFSKNFPKLPTAPLTILIISYCPITPLTVIFFKN